MSRIFPDPYGPQIRQALEQGLRGVSKIASFTAQLFMEAQPFVLNAFSFVATPAVAIKTPTNKVATFGASAPVVQLTNDALKTASFVAVSSIASSTTAAKTADFTALAEVFQI